MTVFKILRRADKSKPVAATIVNGHGVLFVFITRGFPNCMICSPLDYLNCENICFGSVSFDLKFGFCGHREQDTGENRDKRSAIVLITKCPIDHICLSRF